MNILTITLTVIVTMNILLILIAVVRFPSLYANIAYQEKSGRKGYIYAFTDIGQLAPVVKIGRANNPSQRLAAHKTAAPFGLMVYCVAAVSDDVAAESYLHDRYRRWRVSTQNEWFWMTPLMFYELLLMRIILRG